MNRSLVVVAGIAGAAGVALAAAGSHMPGAERLATAGALAMAQAPALLALGLHGKDSGRLLTLCAWVIAAGLVAFSGALTYHDLSGSPALAAIAPIGGTAMIIGWLGIAFAALVKRR